MIKDTIMFYVVTCLATVYIGLGLLILYVRGMSDNPISIREVFIIFISVVITFPGYCWLANKLIIRTDDYLDSRLDN